MTLLEQLNQGEIGATQLAHEWRKGNHEAVLDALEGSHPCVTAVLLVQGSHDNIIRMLDCNRICNKLVDRKTAKNTAETT